MNFGDLLLLQKRPQKLFLKLFLNQFIFLIINQTLQSNSITVGLEENLNDSNKPPNIYQWIEENSHICTTVPLNGESLINFLSVEEGIRCLMCPEIRERDVPTMACAVELLPNEIDVDIGCHQSKFWILIKQKFKFI